MRDNNFDSSHFVQQLEKNFSQFAHNENMELTKQVAIDPNLLERIWIELPQGLNETLALCIGSWWLPEILGILIREEIRERRLNKFSFEDKFLIELCLKSKPETILFLLQTSKWHTRDFFGNFQKLIYKWCKIISFDFRGQRKVKYAQRKRGYNDKGSAVPISKWRPVSDWTLTELQNEIYQKRQVYTDTTKLSEGLLQ
jgi:hypothetical protein